MTNERDRPTPEACDSVAHGFDAAQVVLATLGQVSVDQIQQSMAIALDYLTPYADPAHKIPKAALGIGILAHKMGEHILNHGTIPPDEARTMCYVYLDKAAHYLTIAATMPDHQQDFTPARAMDLLGLMYEHGLLEDRQPNLTKAFDLRHEAAQLGFAEAEMNLAIMYYRGEGVEPSAFMAYSWMRSAWSHREQLSPALQIEVQEMFETLRAESEQESEISIVPPGRPAAQSILVTTIDRPGSKPKVH